MLIEIDLKDAKRQKINLNQYVLVKSLITKVDIKSLAKFIRVSKDEIKDLIEKNILSEDSNPEGEMENLRLSKKYIEEMSSEKLFEDFSSIFPAYVKRPGGYREFLKGAPTRCKKLYEKAVAGSREKHMKILNYLQAEIIHKEKTGKMQYFKKMSNWLSSESWMEMEGMIDNESKMIEEELNKNAYGTEIE